MFNSVINNIFTIGYYFSNSIQSIKKQQKWLSFKSKESQTNTLSLTSNYLVNFELILDLLRAIRATKFSNESYTVARTVFFLSFCCSGHQRECANAQIAMPNPEAGGLSQRSTKWA